MRITPRPARRIRRRGLIIVIALALIGGVIATGADRRGAPAASGIHFNGNFPPQTSTETLRLATFNIHGGRNADRQATLEMTARCLEGFQLVGLNEVWCGPDDADNQAEWLGRKLNLPWLFVPTERRWWHDHRGNGMLCGLPVLQWERIPLVCTQGKGYRSLLFAKVRFGGNPVSVLITHIDKHDDHDAQMTEVMERFLALSSPAILMGDMNANAKDVHLDRLLHSPGVTECLIAIEGPASARYRLDWIFVRGLEPIAAGMIDEGSSDHPCVWAEVRLPK